MAFVSCRLMPLLRETLHDWFWHSLRQKFLISPVRHKILLPFPYHIRPSPGKNFAHATAAADPVQRMKKQMQVRMVSRSNDALEFRDCMTHIRVREIRYVLDETSAVYI